MPTNATLKLIKRLQQKKYRKSEGLFVVEGIKSVTEFLQSDFKVKYLFVHESLSESFPKGERATAAEFKQMSSYTTPPGVLAVFEQPVYELPTILNGHYFVLDGLQDPGNFGTIIRLSDWFGMPHIFCSHETVDAFNPKVIQASMGSFTRVQLHYLDLTSFLQNAGIPVYGTFMDGENMYKTTLEANGLIVLGNEANGITAKVEKCCTERIAIPQPGNSTESLNAAMAAAITAAEFFRQKSGF